MLERSLNPKQAKPDGSQYTEYVQTKIRNPDSPDQPRLVEEIEFENNKELSLLDLFDFAWGLKIYIGVGLVLGVAFAALLPGSVIPVSYLSKASFSIDESSQPSMSNPKEIALRLNNIVTTEFGRDAIHNSFREEIPAFKKFVDSSLEKSSFIKWSPKLTIKPGSLETRFNVELSLPFQTNSPVAVSNGIHKLLNSLVDEINRASFLKQTNAQEYQLRLKKAQHESTLKSLNSSEYKLQEMSFQSNALRAQKLYYKYFSMLEQHNPKIIAFLTSDKDFSKQSLQTEDSNQKLPSQLVYDSASRNLSQAVVLVSMLAESGRIDEKEVEAFNEKYQNIESDLVKSFSKAQSRQNLLKKDIDQLEQAAYAARAPISQLTMLPSFEQKNRTEASSFLSSSFESMKPGRLKLSAFIVAGTLVLALLFGAFIQLAIKLNKRLSVKKWKSSL